MRAAYLLATFVILSSSAMGQKEGVESINKNDLKAHMTFFASDEMKGRDTGTPENEIAALYLKTNIMRIGLKPIPETGDFLQKIPVVASEIKAGDTYIKIKDITGNEVFTTDSLVYLMPPTHTLEAASNFVFAGYGFTDSTLTYNDFENIDLKDKVVMLMTGNPELTDPDDLNSVFNIETESPKFIWTFSQGVKAILYVYDPRSKYSDAYASGLAEMGASSIGSKIMSLRTSEESTGIQVAFITRNTADQLLKKSGNTLKSMQEKILRDKKPVSFESGDITVTFRTVIGTSDVSANNVIGIIEGSDPVLKNECVIYTAHFDHVGVNKEGEAFNGADDNASGSMALLEVADAFMKLKKKPLRTIVFAWVNGEEKGLLGSEYYASNPVYPMDKTLLDINLDMVGRSKTPSDTGKFMGMEVSLAQPGEIFLFTDQTGGELMSTVSAASRQTGMKIINKGKDHEVGTSDYASFMARGVPAIFFNSGIYSDLHSIRDDVGKIDFDKMERVSKMVFLIGYDIANQKKRFVPATVK